MRVPYIFVLPVSLAIVLAGCSSNAPRLPDDKTIQINMLLDEVWAGAGEDRQCLSTSQYSHVEVLGERHLVFRGRGDKAWLNKLRSACPGLRRNDTLMLELHGSRACHADRVSVVDRIVVWRQTGPICTLGEFRPISPDDLQRIDDLVRRK